VAGEVREEKLEGKKKAREGNPQNSGVTMESPVSGRLGKKKAMLKNKKNQRGSV